MARSTVAILFSDIEGSTRLLQTLGPGYADLLMTHRRLLRDAYGAHGGIERGIEGDSFFMTFPTARDAVCAARDGQLALAEHDWGDAAHAVRVRMGVHLGEVELLDDAVIGLAVHETARVCSAAHGGQVLVSSTAQRLADPLPEPSSWTDLGSHRLKDVPTPVHLLQLTHPGLVADFPPLRLQGGVRNNLPLPASTFVGREAELAQVRTLLGQGRLVTITGTGGVGKTRIALRAAADHVERFFDGVRLVDLAPVHEPDAVLATFAETVTSSAGTPEELGAELSDRQMLLVVDNCEHLLGPVADVIGRLLPTTSGVAVLATSREPLGLPGELVWRVPPMTEDDARTLLADRARAVNSQFAVTDQNREAVDEVCRRLDAIPLALELAAARMTTLTPEQVSQRLDRRFRLLSGGSRGSVERHRTLQATVDWSYEHLEPDEQDLLQRLGVFSGGFPLEGAEALATDGDPIAVLDTLDNLVQKSLVIADQRGGETRYRLLETIRQYALDRLGTSDAAYDARTAHLRWAVAMALEARDELWYGNADRWFSRLDDEQANVRSAFEWARDTEPGSATSLLFTLLPWIVTRARSRDWIEPCETLLAEELSAQDRAYADIARLWLYSNVGPIPTEVVDACRLAVPVVDGLDPAWLAPMMRAYLAAWSYPAGDPAAAAAAIPECQRAVESGRGLPIGVQPLILQAMVWVYLDSGQLAEARAVADEAIAAAQAEGVAYMESRLCLHRARVDLADGRTEDARAYAGRSVTVSRATGDTFVATVATRLLAELEEGEGRYDSARDLIASILDDVEQTQSGEQLARVRAELERCAALARGEA